MAATTPKIIAATRPTYPQDWRTYNPAQVAEQEKFQLLLHDLCATVPGWPPHCGRPPLPLRDAIFAITYKVYLEKSTRRAMGFFRDPLGRGCISTFRLPCYNTIINYMGDDRLTPILFSLVQFSALPLRDLEQRFAFDSSGFTTSRLVSWNDHKSSKESHQHDWVKFHLACGVLTHIVTAVVIKGRNASDAQQFPLLLETTARNFKILEAAADNAYCSQKNMELVAAVGGIPYIAFRSNTTGSCGGTFRKMFYLFQADPDEFYRKYHQRSNVEAALSMMKRKFGGSLRSRTETAMKNEVLCKVLSHNIVVLIHAMYKLGIEPDFWGRPASTNSPEVAVHPQSNSGLLNPRPQLRSLPSTGNRVPSSKPPSVAQQN